MNSKHLLIGLSALTLSAPLLAREFDCTNKDLDRAHWIPIAQMQEKIAAQGHKDVVVEIVGNCYKAHYQENGRKIESLYDPIEGHPIRRQTEQK